MKSPGYRPWVLSGINEKINQFFRFVHELAGDAFRQGEGRIEN
jgi:hypothetical protein